MIIDMTDITRELEKDRRCLTRLDAFLRCGSVETSICTIHEGQMHEEPEAETDPHGQWNNRRYVMGFSIETEHRGCHRFHVLAKGRDWRDTLDRGLAAWEKDGVNAAFTEAGD